jgi:hypothetical protein
MLILNNRLICSYEEVLKPQGFVIASIEDNDVAVEPRKVCMHVQSVHACFQSHILITIIFGQTIFLLVYV